MSFIFLFFFGTFVSALYSVYIDELLYVRIWIDTSRSDFYQLTSLSLYIFYLWCFRLVQFGLFCGFCAMVVMHGMEKKISAHISVFVWILYLCVPYSKLLILLNGKSHQRHQMEIMKNTNCDVSISNQKKMRCARFSQANWSIVQIKTNRSAVIYGTEFFSEYTTLSQSVRLLLLLLFFHLKTTWPKQKKIVLDIFLCLYERNALY